MTKDEIAAWALSRGWTQDEFGNLKKEWQGRQYRLKLGDRKLRYEIQTKMVDEFGTEYGWQRLSSAAYKDLSIKDGKLYGMKMRM